MECRCESEIAPAVRFPCIGEFVVRKGNGSESVARLAVVLLHAALEVLTPPLVVDMLDRDP